ncbi:MAG: serine hydrolase domain-containing protein [Caldilineaceae bacterium]
MNDQNIFEQLTTYTQQTMDETGVPGVAIGVLHKGQVQSAGLGVTNVDHPLAVDEQTLFQIGSITKTFTALLMMKLAEMGKLDLSASVRTYLPDFRVADEVVAQRVTVRHLLTHNSGWAGDVFEDTGAGDDALSRYLKIMAEVAQLAPMETTFSYNNAAFYVAGALIEAITGQSYQAALRELVLAPMGLAHVYFDPADVMTYRFAVGHSVKEEDGAHMAEVARPWPLPRAAYAVGGIACSIPTLLQYAAFQMGDGTTASGERLISPAALAQLHAPQFEIGGTFDAVAHSWFIGHVDGVKYITHSGGTTGQISLLLIVPERHFAVAIFTNANRGSFVTRDVSRWALREYLGLHMTDPESLALSAEELAPFVGLYSRPFANAELKLDEGELTLQVTPKQGFPSRETPPGPPSPVMRVAFYDTDRLIVLDGPLAKSRAEIVRDGDGAIGWLRVGSRIHRRM